MKEQWKDAPDGKFEDFLTTGVRTADMLAAGARAASHVANAVGFCRGGDDPRDPARGISGSGPGFGGYATSSSSYGIIEYFMGLCMLHSNVILCVFKGLGCGGGGDRFHGAPSSSFPDAWKSPPLKERGINASVAGGKRGRPKNQEASCDGEDQRAEGAKRTLLEGSDIVQARRETVANNEEQ